MLRNKVLFISALLSFVSTAEAEPRAGVIIPLTGPAATYGVACKNGVEMAKSDFKEKIGDRFKIIFEDDQNSRTQTVSCIRKLRVQDKSDFMLTFSSSTSTAVGPLAEKENFILFALATDPKVVENKKNVFNYWVTPDEEVKKLLVELTKRNIKRIAIFSTQHEGTLAFKRTLEMYSGASGIEIIFEDEFSPEDKDFRTTLTKVAKLKNLDGIFNNLYVDQVGLLPKQARDIGIKVPVFNWELYESQAVVDSAQGALEGQFFATASAGIKDFENKYREKFPTDSIIAAAECYDFVGLLATSPTLTVDGVRNYLENLKDYPGASGKSSATGDHRFTLPAVIKEVRGNEFIALEH